MSTFTAAAAPPVCKLDVSVSAETPFTNRWDRSALSSIRGIQSVWGRTRLFNTSTTLRSICTLSKETWSTWSSVMLRYGSRFELLLTKTDQKRVGWTRRSALSPFRTPLTRWWSVPRCLPCLPAYPLCILQSLLSSSQSCSSATSCTSKLLLLFGFFLIGNPNIFLILCIFSCFLSQKSTRSSS